MITYMPVGTPGGLKAFIEHEVPEEVRIIQLKDIGHEKEPQ